MSAARVCRFAFGRTGRSVWLGLIFLCRAGSSRFRFFGGRGGVRSGERGKFLFVDLLFGDFGRVWCLRECGAPKYLGLVGTLALPVFSVVAELTVGDPVRFKPVVQFFGSKLPERTPELMRSI